MCVGQSSVDGNIVILYRIIIETIQVFCFGKVGRGPVCIAMCEDILITMVIVREVVE